MNASPTCRNAADRPVDVVGDEVALRSSRPRCCGAAPDRRRRPRPPAGRAPSRPDRPELLTGGPELGGPVPLGDRDGVGDVALELGRRWWCRRRGWSPPPARPGPRGATTAAVPVPGVPVAALPHPAGRAADRHHQRRQRGDQRSVRAALRACRHRVPPRRPGPAVGGTPAVERSCPAGVPLTMGGPARLAPSGHQGCPRRSFRPDWCVAPPRTDAVWTGPPARRPGPRPRRRGPGRARRPSRPSPVSPPEHHPHRRHEDHDR